VNWRTVQPQSEQPDLRLLAIVVVFAVVGPPIGGAVFFLSLGIIGALFADSGPSGLEVVTRMAGLAVGGIVFSYLFGFIPAIAAGMLIAVLQLCMTRVPWYAVLVVGLCVGAGFSNFFGSSMVVQVGLPVARPFAYLLNIFTCVASALICWAMVCNWHASRTPDNEASSGAPKP
jgi:hypothetical protein